MQTHTPGPWLDELDPYLDTAFAVAKGEEKWKYPPRRIEDAEVIANARLMAAAPELLNALKVWAKFARDNGWTDAEFNSGDPAVNGWITMTDSAIKKAQHQGQKHD